LIKRTFFNFHTYFLSLSSIPVGVTNQLEKLQRDSLWGHWGGLDDEHKFHLVNWKKVCTPIQVEGLKIRSLTTFNQALLGKWLWRFVVERKTFWR
jgi:hypothetical protein